MDENKGQNDDPLISVRESKQMFRSDNYLPLLYGKDKISDSIFFLFRCSTNNEIVPLQYYSNGHIEWDHVFLGYLQGCEASALPWIKARVKYERIIFLKDMYAKFEFANVRTLWSY